MTIRNHIASLAVLSIVLGSACSRIDKPSDGGGITLSFSSSALETRSVTPGDTDPADGGKIVIDGSGDPDIIIAITNGAGTVVARYPGTAGADCITSHTANTPDTQTTISIPYETPGTYKVYAVANTAGLSEVGNPSLAAASALSTGTAAALDALTLSGTPDFSSSCMPLSAVGSVTVNSGGNGQIDLELKRVMARIKLTFYNNVYDGTDVNPVARSISIKKCTVTLKKMNPSSGYLFPASPDLVPNSYANLALCTDKDDIPVFTSGESQTIGPVLVFPSEAPSNALGAKIYYCDISFRIVKQGSVYNAADDETYDEYTNTDLPVQDLRTFVSITELLRNQSLEIRTEINKSGAQSDISFNFKVCDWTEKTETVFFH